MTVSQLAKEIGITPQAIYQKIKSKQFNNKFKKDVNGKLVLDGESIEFIKSLFVNTLEKDVNEFINVDNQFKAENIELKKKIEQLEKRLHNQSDRVLNLAEQLAELTRNNQVLLGMQQNKSAPKMIEADNKKSLWGFFRKKKDN